MRAVLCCSARLRSLVRWLTLWGLAVAPAIGADDAPESDSIRPGFTYAMFYSVNENDAKAAMRSMAAEFARQSGLKGEPDPHLYDTYLAMAEGIRQREVNYVGITTEEYNVLRHLVAFDRFLCAINDGEVNETYLVLTHRSMAYASLSELKDRHLIVAPGPRLSLAPLWLDVELTHQGHAAANDFFQSVTEATKPAKAVLAVFFRQADACLVTRRMFQTMVELNPQLATELRITATSPGYVPNVFAFSAQFPADLKERSIREFVRMHESVAGQQILTIFQTRQTGELSPAALEPSLALIEEHTKICPQASAVRRARLLNPRGFDRLK